MSDTFYFRDFSMRQAPSGQRINTDSCVFGSLIGGLEASPKHIIDIGTGTGLLALMLAIRFPESSITAVEPEVDIANVARENFNSSAWRERIDLKTNRAQDLPDDLNESFDFVVCNPPYFQNSSLSNDRLRDVARHNIDLSPPDLYTAMSRLMTEDGSAWLSFPEHQTELWTESGTNAGLHLTHQTLIKDHPDARPHIAIAGWSRHRPLSIANDVFHYRVAHRGPQSDRMKAFRDQWFPGHYNVQFSVPH